MARALGVSLGRGRELSAGVGALRAEAPTPQHAHRPRPTAGRSQRPLRPRPRSHAPAPQSRAGPLAAVSAASERSGCPHGHGTACPGTMPGVLAQHSTELLLPRMHSTGPVQSGTHGSAGAEWLPPARTPCGVRHASAAPAPLRTCKGVKTANVVANKVVMALEVSIGCSLSSQSQYSVPATETCSLQQRRGKTCNKTDY